LAEALEEGGDAGEVVAGGVDVGEDLLDLRDDAALVVERGREGDCQVKNPLLRQGLPCDAVFFVVNPALQ
jgi:hypothetical protein